MTNFLTWNGGKTVELEYDDVSNYLQVCGSKVVSASDNFAKQQLR